MAAAPPAIASTFQLKKKVYLQEGEMQKVHVYQVYSSPGRPHSWLSIIWYGQNCICGGPYSCSLVLRFISFQAPSPLPAPSPHTQKLSVVSHLYQSMKFKQKWCMLFLSCTFKTPVYRLLYLFPSVTNYRNIPDNNCICLGPRVRTHGAEFMIT